MDKKNEFDEEEMTVELELEDGSVVTCAVVTILTVEEKDYIALLPLNEAGENEEYDRVSDAFDEFLDSCEFDEIVEEES